MVLVDVTILVVMVPVAVTSSVRVTVVPLVASVAVRVPVGTDPTKVAVVAMVVVVLVTTVEGTVTVSVAVVDGVVVVAVVDAVTVAAAMHRRAVLQAVPLLHWPEAGQRPSNLVHWYGAASGRVIPPQPKVITQAKTSWQVQPLGQLSLAVQL